ncbi:MAG: hypothetical protein MJY87_01210 [Fibrobacter sp.]|nr:hypothetical protein [Fibrobacter sp.]
MQKKVLFLCDGFGKANDATGICVRNVAYEFQRNGYSVFCIYNSEKKHEHFSENGIEFYGVKWALYDAMHSLCSKMVLGKCLFLLFSFLRRFFVSVFYPNVSFFRSKKYLKIAREIIKREKISLVVGCYRPYESIYSVMTLKSMFKENVFCVGYHLDLTTNPNTANKWIKSFQEKKAWRAALKEQQILDMIVLPRAIQNRKFEFNNTKFADFPVCIPDMTYEEFALPYVQDYCNLVYIGTLNAQNRNPKHAIDMFESILNANGKKIVWHIWGCVEQELKPIIEKSQSVFYHGMLENSKVVYALKNADVIVNISNEQTVNMVPSKIFQYFSTSRPILNFVSSNIDVSIPYFEEYGNALNVFKNATKEENCVKIKNFLEDGQKNDFIVNSDFLSKSTPKYFFDIVEKEFLK